MEEKCFDIERMFLIKKIYEKTIRKISLKDKITASYAVFAQAMTQRDFFSQQELSDFVGCNKAHTSRTLFKMQVKGFIEPIKKDHPFRLTREGKKLAQTMFEDKKRFMDHLLKDIPESDIKVFANVLDQVLLNAENLKI